MVADCRWQPFCDLTESADKSRPYNQTERILQFVGDDIPNTRINIENNVNNRNLNLDNNIKCDIIFPVIKLEHEERKPTRLKYYDYSSAGAYFLTICVKDRKELLSKIIVGDGVLDVPKNILTQYGKIADKYINQMKEFYKHIDIDKYVIMPDHIHLILSITNAKTRKQMIENHGTSRTPSPTKANSEISKFISTFKRFCNKEYGENIWQRSYYDHIIRNEEDFLNIWKYIDGNPIKSETEKEM